MTVRSKIDLLICSGTILISIGAYFIYPPAAPVSAGIIILALGIWGALIHTAKSK